MDPLKYKPIVFLEIGVYAGESLRYFRDFFTHPETKIIGADDFVDFELSGNKITGKGRIKNCVTEIDPSVIIEKGNQSNHQFLDKLCSYGPFDVIMDDASHNVGLTKNTFKKLWPHVKQGGFYLIEDMGYEDMHPLLDEVVTTGQGKGFISLNSLGFGPRAGAGGITILKKTRDLVTGLDSILVE